MALRNTGFLVMKSICIAIKNGSNNSVMISSRDLLENLEIEAAYV